MSRILFVLIVTLAAAACHHDPEVMQPKPGELPPLPPASGTAVGYLVDAAVQLDLTGDQLDKLKQIDQSLAARNDVLDTQLRSIEQPAEEEPEKGQPPPRHNNAPGAQIKTTPAAAKLHAAKKANDKEALGRAFAILDATQQEKARRILDDRGIVVPNKDEPKKKSFTVKPLQ